MVTYLHTRPADDEAVARNYVNAAETIARRAAEARSTAAEDVARWALISLDDGYSLDTDQILLERLAIYREAGVAAAEAHHEFLAAQDTLLAAQGAA